MTYLNWSLKDATARSLLTSSCSGTYTLKNSSGYVANFCLSLPLVVAYTGLQKYENLEFLRPLVQRMIRKDPAERPSAQEVLETFDSLVKSQSWFNRRRRLRRHGETRSQTFLRDFVSFWREEVFLRLSRKSFLSCSWHSSDLSITQAGNIH